MTRCRDEADAKVPLIAYAQRLTARATERRQASAADSVTVSTSEPTSTAAHSEARPPVLVCLPTGDLCLRCTDMSSSVYD